MEQIRQNFKEDKSQNLKDLAAEFESLKSQPIEKATEWTVVNLKLKAGCGCGGSTEKIHIALPGNHPNLKDKIHDEIGSYTISIEDVEILEERYPDAKIMLGYSDYEGVTDQYNPDDFYSI